VTLKCLPFGPFYHHSITNLLVFLEMSCITTIWLKKYSGRPVLSLY
jgi:hypothetical protein